MEAAEQQGLREGCAAVVLHVFTGNAAAIRFYTERGFVQSHREVDFYGPDADAWVFQKLLARTE
jgi:ribosomal protein S18 acetylase RimI-like enzyme